MIRSIIEYGAQLYMEGKKNREKIQKIHNAGIRTAMEYRMSTPINVMEVEAGIMKMEVRIELLTEKYLINKYYRKNKTVCNAIEERIKYGREVRGGGERDWILEAWKETKELRENMEGAHETDKRKEWNDIKVKTWIEKEKGMELAMGGTPEETIIKEIKNKIFGKEEEIIEIYTDGSRRKGREQGGAAVITKETNGNWEEQGFTTSKYCSVFTIEAGAVNKAIETTEKQEIKQDVLILTDSLSTVNAIENERVEEKEEGVIGKIRERIKKKNYKNRGEERGRIGIAWIPVHVGIEGNEKADRVAKEYTEGEEDESFKHTIKDARRMIREKKWKKSTEENLRQGEFKGRRYFEAEWNNVGRFFPWFREIGNVEKKVITMLSRVRADHYNLNWSLYRKTMTNSPECEKCGEVEDFEHIMWRCQKYDEIRRTMRRVWQENEIEEEAVFHNTKRMGLPKVLRLIGSYMKKCKLNI